MARKMVGFGKKALALTAVWMLLLALALPCYAQGTDVVVAQYTEDLGDGVTAIVTITESQGPARATKTSNVSKTYYDGGVYVGVAVLTATFSYNGSAATVVSVGGRGSGANGWSYGGQSTWSSGNTAYLSASLTKDGRSIGVNLSLRCDANGNLS